MQTFAKLKYHLRNKQKRTQRAVLGFVLVAAIDGIKIELMTKQRGDIPFHFYAEQGGESTCCYSFGLYGTTHYWGAGL